MLGPLRLIRVISLLLNLARILGKHKLKHTNLTYNICNIVDIFIQNKSFVRSFHLRGPVNP